MVIRSITINVKPHSFMITALAVSQHDQNVCTHTSHFVFLSTLSKSGSSSNIKSVIAVCLMLSDSCVTAQLQLARKRE